MNNQTKIEKVRHNPPRPRDYSYRKAQWKCPKCSQKLSYGSRFLHLRLKHGGRVHQCPHCKYGAKDRDRLVFHINRKHEGILRPKKFECDICSKRFCFDQALIRHKKLEHERKQLKIRCAVCVNPVTFSTSGELGRHYREWHPRDVPFDCQFCDKCYKTPAALKLHYMAKHKQGELMESPDCDLLFSRKDKMESHRLQHTEHKAITREHKIHPRCLHITPKLRGKPEVVVCHTCQSHLCEYCSYTFKSKRLFANHTHKNFCAICVIKFPDKNKFALHSAYHEPPNVILFRCELCKFGFATHQRLNVHAQKMHGIQMKRTLIACKVCDKTFMKDHLLTMHMKLHVPKPDRKCPCPWCKEGYTTKTLLFIHLHRKHTGERAFRCAVHGCEKNFVTNSDLRRHHRHVHPGSMEQPRFRCYICEATLKSKRNLDLHMMTHEENQFPCSVCKKRFCRKSYLKLHMMMHSKDGRKPHPCMWCEKSYMNPVSLQQHLVTIHNKEMEVEDSRDYEAFKCPDCFKTFQAKSHLAVHVRNRSCRPHECQRCKRVFTSLKGLGEHQKTKKKCVPPEK